MRNKTIKIIALLLAALLLAGLAAGCGSNNTAPANNSSNNAAQPGNEADPGNTNTVEPPKDGTVYVSSMEELIAAIKPGAKIVIKAGIYDIGAALSKIWAAEGDKFNEEHEYLFIDNSNDGYSLEVAFVENLSISGETGNAGDTLLISKYRNSTVFGFRYCSGLELKGLTMGHTQQSDCTGDVLVIVGCEDAVLDSLDLYGCGVYALRFEGALGDMSVKNTVLRDCSGGAFYDNGYSGNIVFEDCTLTGSDGIPYFELSVNSTMIFRRCGIGVRESEFLSFCDYVILEDCNVAEPQNYPEYYSPIGQFIPDMLEESAADASVLVKDGKWLVFTMAEKSMDITSGEYKPYTDLKDGSPLRMYLVFADDGTGIITGYKDHQISFTWTVDKNLVRYETETGAQSTIEFYKITDTLSGEYDTWLCMDLDGYDYWINLKDWV